SRLRYWPTADKGPRLSWVKAGLPTGWPPPSLSPCGCCWQDCSSTCSWAWGNTERHALPAARSQADRRIKSAVDEPGRFLRVVVHGWHDSCHDRMAGGQMAHRVGRRGITQELEGLAAAAAEIDRLTRATPARLGHPVDTAEAVERGRVVPDPGQRSPPHILDGQSGYLAGRLAGEHVPVRHHGQLLVAPTAQAGLGVHAVVVCDDVDDLHPPCQARARGTDDRLGALKLIPGGQEGGAVVQRPPIVLGIRQLQAICL